MCITYINWAYTKVENTTDIKEAKYFCSQDVYSFKILQELTSQLLEQVTIISVKNVKYYSPSKNYSNYAYLVFSLLLKYQ